MEAKESTQRKKENKSTSKFPKKVNKSWMPALGGHGGRVPPLSLIWVGIAHAP